MTEPAPLTDEELARLEETALLVLRPVGPENTCGPGGMQCGYDIGEECLWHEPSQVVEHVPHLIADLRASRAEVERLRVMMRRLLADTAADCRTGVPDSFCGCPAHLRVRETAAEAESLLP